MRDTDEISEKFIAAFERIAAALERLAASQERFSPIVFHTQPTSVTQPSWPPYQCSAADPETSVPDATGTCVPLRGLALTP